MSIGQNWSLRNPGMYSSLTTKDYPMLTSGPTTMANLQALWKQLYPPPTSVKESTWLTHHVPKNFTFIICFLHWIIVCQSQPACRSKDRATKYVCGQYTHHELHLIVAIVSTVVKQLYRATRKLFGDTAKHNKGFVVGNFSNVEPRCAILRGTSWC